MSHREHIPEETFPSDEEFDDEEEDGDSDSSTDVDAKLAEEEVFDDEFFRCYSALKKKDSKIYDQNVKFFNEEEKSESEEDKETEESSKPKERLLDLHLRYGAPKMTLLDHQLNLKEDEIEDPKIDLNKPVSKSFYEKELEEIKKSIERVTEEVDSDSDDELFVVKGSDGEASKPRKKINSILDELEQREDEDLKRLKEIWSDSSKLSKEDKFLRDYILNKRYVSTNTEEQAEEGSSSGKKNPFFSENIDKLSDVDTGDDETTTETDTKLHLHSEDKDFDKIKRIPRNSTKTIRDMKEKQEKKEKRQKKLEAEKKKKKALKNACCEDIVGDLKTRFHYRETEPNDYGLSAEELLMATDEELEQWVRLNQAIAYKSRQEELSEKMIYERKRNDLELKRKIFKSIYEETSEIADHPGKSGTLEPEGKKSRKRKRGKADVTLIDANDEEAEKIAEDEPVIEESNRQKKKKKHRRGLNHKKFAKVGVAPDRLLAYGLSKTRLKRSKLL